MTVLADKFIHLLLGQNQNGTQTAADIGGRIFPQLRLWQQWSLVRFTPSEKYWSVGIPIPNIWKNQQIPKHQTDHNHHILGTFVDLLIGWSCFDPQPISINLSIYQTLGWCGMDLHWPATFAMVGISRRGTRSWSLHRWANSPEKLWLFRHFSAGRGISRGRLEEQLGFMKRVPRIFVRFLLNYLKLRILKIWFIEIYCVLVVGQR